MIVGVQLLNEASLNRQKVKDGVAWIAKALIESGGRDKNECGLSKTSMWTKIYATPWMYIPMSA